MRQANNNSELDAMFKPLNPSEFGRYAKDLQRPECVLITPDGAIYTSDHRGGVMCISAQGEQSLLGRSSLIPNGIALQPDGSFLVANLGTDGGVWHLDPSGQIKPWCLEFENQTLPRVNYVTTDDQGRHWMCISATKTDDHYPVDEATGFILLQDEKGIRCVANQLRYTNELRFSQDGKWLYVNETFGRCLTRFALKSDGSLSQRQTIATFEAGDFPDGLAMDAWGGIWVVCVGSNRVYRVTPEGQRQTIIDDSEPDCVQRLEQAFQSRVLTRPMMAQARGKCLKNITSLAFGGPDLRTAYMGSLDSTELITFRSPVAGARPSHWNWS